MSLAKILVAIDRSDNSRKVFEQALALAQPLQAQLMLLHILNPNLFNPAEPGITPTTSLFFAESGYLESSENLVKYGELWQLYQTQGQELLQAWCKEAIAAGVEAETQQIPGSPGRTICEQAKDWQADAIAIGRRGHSALGELLVGSVSNYVFHHAPCSVFVIYLPDLDPTAAEETSEE